MYKPMHIGMYQWIQGPEVLQLQLSARSRRALLRRVSRDACIGGNIITIGN